VPYIASGHGWLAGDWPSTAGILNITAAAWTAGFQWWRSGDITRMQNVSEYMLILALCLVQFSTVSTSQEIGIITFCVKHSRGEMYTVSQKSSHL